MSQHLIPNSFVRWHFAAVESQPQQVTKVRSMLSVPDKVFSTDGRILTANQFARVISETIKISNDESFGALVTPLARGSFHMMAFACISCKTLEQAIRRAFAYYHILRKELCWKLSSADKISSLDFGREQQSKESESNIQYDYFITFMSCVLWRFFSWLIDKPIPLKRVCFHYPKPDGIDEIGLLFKITPEFSQPQCYVSFDSNLLNAPVKQTVDSLDKFLMHVPECLLSHFQEEISLSKQVREYLEQQEDFHGMTVQHLANQFYCSEPSFIRYLRAEGTKFSAIRDQVRKQRAQQWLLTSHLSNQEISQKLGFADPTVFYRNFKKWFGRTPNQFRSQS